MVRAESLPQRGCRSGYTEHRPPCAAASMGRPRSGDGVVIGDNPGMAGEERFAALVEAMLGLADPTDAAAGTGPQRGFGSTSLKTNGKIFAMLVQGRLVVKLDRRRVDALVSSGDGERFDPGHGRLMKEWLAIESASDDDWLALATESEAFVAGRTNVPSGRG